MTTFLNFLHYYFSAHRYMRTIPNTFIANMSLSDLLMAVLNCSFNYVTMRDRKWDFGQAYCTINNFMAIVTVTASVLNLTAMSLDRWEWRNFVTFSKVMRHLLGLLMAVLNCSINFVTMRDSLIQMTFVLALSGRDEYWFSDNRYTVCFVKM